ncbi:MAG: efflux transporter outer membrane subunit [Pseudomonadota bacterium]
MTIENHTSTTKHTLVNIAVAGSLLLLSGCISMSGINPHAKTTDTNQLSVGKTITTAKTIAWPKEDWWKAFNDTQLDALIAQTITDSPTLHVAQARVSLSQAFADSMHAETKPNVSADASAIRERFTELQFIPPPWAGNFDWNNKATLSLAYDLDLWGRQESIWHASIDETRAATVEVQQVKLELESAVVRSYVQLAMQFNLRDIAEERLAEIQQRVSITQRSRAAGLGTEMEVREAETPLPMARAHIESINAHISLLRNQLAALTGKGPGAGETITRPTMHLNSAIGLPEQLPANLIGRRPDVLAFRWRVEAAQYNIESAKAMFYPNINLIGFIGFQALGFGQLISNAASIAGVGPAFSLPIFDGGRRRGNLTAKTASYDIAVENYNGVLVRALQDVSDQLVMLQSNTKQRKEAEQALDSALKAHALAERSYIAGLSNYQHVLDTKSIVLHYEEIIAQLQATKLDGYANLMRALGGGTIEPPAPEAAHKP